MAYLILIRHSTSQPQSDVSSHTWQLTDDGRQQCVRLAERLRPYNVRHIYSSDEPKAVQTAQLVAQDLGGLPVIQNAQLRETQRNNVPFYADVNAFHGVIRAAMSQPDELLFGEETFSAARDRFAQAVKRIVATTQGETVALVSHATIESLYIASLIDVHPYDIWKLLDMPAYAVFALPNMKLIEICFSLPQS